MDINSPHVVAQSVPQLRNAVPVDQDCTDHLYCGMPYLVPVLTMIWKTHYLPGPTPKLVTPVFLEVVSRDKTEDGERVSLKIGGLYLLLCVQSCVEVVRLFLVNFTKASVFVVVGFRKHVVLHRVMLLGPNHLGVMVSPVKGVELMKWSFEGTVPLAGPSWNGRDTYFIYYAYGRTPVDLEFWMDFKVSQNFCHVFCDVSIDGMNVCLRLPVKTTWNEFINFDFSNNSELQVMYLHFLQSAHTSCRSVGIPTFCPPTRVNYIRFNTTICVCESRFVPLLAPAFTAWKKKEAKGKWHLLYASVRILRPVVRCCSIKIAVECSVCICIIIFRFRKDIRVQ